MKNKVFTKDSDASVMYFADETGEHVITPLIRAELSAETTDATPVVMTVDNGSFVIASDEVWAYEGIIIAVDETNLDKAVYKVKGLLLNDGGTTTEIVAAETEDILVKEDVSWALDVTANDTADTLEVSVTGDATNTVNWKGSFNFTKVASA